MKKKIFPFLLMLLIVTGFMSASVVQAKTSVGKCTVKVTAKGRKLKKTIQAGEKLRLVVKDGKKQIGSDRVVFSSSKKKVVKVSRKGIITAVKEGTAVVTICYKSKKAKLTVTVSAKEPPGASVKDPEVRPITPMWVRVTASSLECFYTPNGETAKVYEKGHRLKVDGITADGEWYRLLINDPKGGTCYGYIYKKYTEKV